MKTYAETKGAAPFDWNAFLANPPDIGSQKHDTAKHLSLSWVTCACGNLCEALARDDAGQPEDEHLADQGGLFHGAICTADWPKARQTLAAIEARSAQLLKELQS